MELMDKSKIPLFLKRKETAPIVMIKQKEQDGHWVDEDDEKLGAPQYGALFPRIKEDTTKKKRPTGKPQKGKENVDDECIIGLKRESRHQFETIFKLGDVFRFESNPALNNYSFWVNKKHRQNEIYRYTVEEQKPEGLKIQTVIETHHKTDPEVFKLNAETDFKDQGTPRGDLNEKQFAAVKMALNPNRVLVCIQGPPGTGKSHVLSIFLYKLLKEGKQAVVLTPTKEALKNLKAMTLKAIHERAMKLHPHALMDVSLFKEILNTSSAADEAIKTIRKWREMYKDGELDKNMLDEKRNGLTRDLRQQTLDLVMQNLRIVFATMESTFTLQILRSNQFNPEVCVVDEAAQVMETATWPAVNQMKRIVMAGDPKQLPALVKTEEAKARQLERSVMERIIEKKDQYSWIMLEEQYRSHRDITDWSNGCFYDCKLTNCTDMNNTLHTSLDPKPSKTFSKLFNPLVMIDTCLVTDTNDRIQYYEKTMTSDTATEPNNTYCNYGEAELVMKHYERLLSMSIPPQDIAIITPYKGQIDVLTAKMNEFVANNEAFDPSNLTTIGTIDSVQGQEYDCVIFSMVRSNPKTTIGFISEVRRLNVVVTRAKRHFIFIGNGYMLNSSHKPEIRKFFATVQHKEQRFHPNLVCGIPAPGMMTNEVRNNFGRDFKPFIENSNDPRMIQWCLEFIENSKKPQFVQKRRERAERKAEELRIRAQMDYEARELKRQWMTETAIWDSIGLLVLKGYNDKEVTSGLRPVMELMDKSKIPLFLKRKETAPIVMIKQKEQDGHWVDEDDEKLGAPQYGALFPRIKEDTTKKKRPTGKPQKGKENVDDECIIGLKRESRHQFETIFKLGDVFRFESNPALNNYSFWVNKKHRQNEIYRYTVEEQKPEGLKIQTVIETHHKTDPEVFKLKAETDFKDQGTPRGDLNEKQFAAVKMALNPNRVLVCIQGPPGTGKSHVLSIFLYKLLKEGKQAVVLTPTKEALKNLKAMTLKAIHERAMKLHPHALMDVSLFKEILNTSSAADEAIKTIRKWREMYKDGELDKNMLDEKRNGLTRDLRQQTLDLVMQNLRIVFATMESTFTLQILRSNQFNPEVCVVDEAAQVMETATWPAVNQMKRIVMAGDPKQLPALVKTEEAKARQLERSVMERIIEKKDQYSWIMLEDQYRSHRDITDWSNGCFYDCKLTNCTDMNNTLHTSLDPKPSKTFSKLFNPLVMIDTCLVTDTNDRIQYYEKTMTSDTATEPNNTYCNYGEAELVMKHYERLLSMSIPPQDIAIITPYKGQIDVLTAKMNEFVANNEAFDPSNLTTIGTIDSVQGQEYDCVIFSMVRSNPKTTIGFISEVRRLNVVVTRAKRHFIFIGNGYMLNSSHKPEIRKFFATVQHKEQRFHPNLVCGIPAPGMMTNEVRNNFGRDFKPFIENSNDPRMIQWCLEFIENSKKPNFVQKRRERAERKAEELRIRAQMDFEARELKRQWMVNNNSFQQDPSAPIP